MKQLFKSIGKGLKAIGNATMDTIDSSLTFLFHKVLPAIGKESAKQTAGILDELVTQGTNLVEEAFGHKKQKNTMFSDMLSSSQKKQGKQGQEIDFELKPKQGAAHKFFDEKLTTLFHKHIPKAAKSVFDFAFGKNQGAKAEPSKRDTNPVAEAMAGTKSAPKKSAKQENPIASAMASTKSEVPAGQENPIAAAAALDLPKGPAIGSVVMAGIHARAANGWEKFYESELQGQSKGLSAHL